MKFRAQQIYLGKVIKEIEFEADSLEHAKTEAGDTFHLPDNTSWISIEELKDE